MVAGVGAVLVAVAAIGVVLAEEDAEHSGAVEVDPEAIAEAVRAGARPTEELTVHAELNKKTLHNFVEYKKLFSPNARVKKIRFRVHRHCDAQYIYL